MRERNREKGRRIRLEGWEGEAKRERLEKAGREKRRRERRERGLRKRRGE